MQGFKPPHTNAIILQSTYVSILAFLHHARINGAMASRASTPRATVTQTQAGKAANASWTAPPGLAGLEPFPAGFVASATVVATPSMSLKT